MNEARVLFTTLSMRKSAKGNDYCTGWLGGCELVGFPGDPDRHGHPTWKLFIKEREPREGDAPPAAAAVVLKGRA